MSPKLRKFLFTIGKVFSPLYSVLMVLRAKLYAIGLFSSVKLSVPVVSVGNLTMGGTGKTPVVMYLAQLFAKQYRPAVISRGYGGKSLAAVNIVSDGQRVLMTPAEAGDEPVLLAQSLPGIPVITGAKRKITGKYVEEKDIADLIIMDDGFQHLALDRDLNLTLFSGEELLGDGWVFPGGVLREPMSALERSDVFVVTGVTAQNRKQVDLFKQKLHERFSAVPQFEVSYIVQDIICKGGNSSQQGSAEVEGKTLFAFCGIAKPESFFAMLRAERLKLGGCKAFADHHGFTESDVNSVWEESVGARCDGLITTEKDYVKIEHLSLQKPIWVVKLGVAASEGFDAFVLNEIDRVTSR